MTTTVSQEAVEVTQADRDAAQAILDTWFNRSMIEMTLARHRQQAERAFEERERKLREVVNELLAAQDAIDNWSAHTEGQEWCEALFRRQRAFLAVSQALKETPDVQ